MFNYVKQNTISRNEWFFRNLQILENPENFTKKNIFCTRFVLSKLYCSSKQKKVIAKTKMSKSRLWRPVAGPQWPGWPNEVIWAGFRSKWTYWWNKIFGWLWPVLVTSGDLVSELGIFVLAVTFLCFELERSSLKEKCGAKKVFLVKFFLFPGILRSGRDMAKKPVLGYPS